MQTLAIFLKESRLNAGLSQKDVSKVLGYSSSQFISNWERGVSQPPITAVKKISQAYKVKPEAMLDALITDTVETVKKDIKERFDKS